MPLSLLTATDGWIQLSSKNHNFVMTTFYKNHLIVKQSKIEGYGVFAAKKLAMDELIEKTPILIFNYEPDKQATPNNDPLRNCYFALSDPKKKALPLGLAALYNHANEPNAGYQFDADAQTMTIKALRPIAKGEEILISYSVNWFEYRNMAVVAPSKPLSWSVICRSLVFKVGLLLAIIVSTSVLLKHKPSHHFHSDTLPYRVPYQLG